MLQGLYATASHGGLDGARPNGGRHRRSAASKGVERPRVGLVMPILFCNISWMEKYAGRSSADPPLGGGSFPETEGYCGEDCNFVPCDDGFIYGHFETLKDSLDRQVSIERLGARKQDDRLDGVDIVWTAPWEGKDPRVVVGWSRKAQLYRFRQHFAGQFPSDRHRQAEITSFRVKARTEDVVLPAAIRTPSFRAAARICWLVWSDQLVVCRQHK